MIGAFILINLSIALKFNSSEKGLGLISIFKTAIAGNEDCWNCPPDSDCGYKMTDADCPPGSLHETSRRCDPVCEVSECNVSEQTFCNE